MRKIFSFVALMAMVAVGLVSCQNDIDEQVGAVAGEQITVEVTAGAPATRSQFGEKVEGGYTSTWSGTESVYFALNDSEDGVATVAAQPSGAGKSARFVVTLTDDGTTEGAIYAFSPVGKYGSPAKGGFTSSKLYSKYQNSFVVVPAEQTPLEASCDESAHLLVGSHAYTNGIPTTMEMTFGHILAYGQMTLKGFEGEVKSVKLTFPTKVAGSSCKYYYAGEKTGTVEGMLEESIVLYPDNVKDGVYWFGIVATGELDGDMTIVVTDSDDNTYTKPLATTGKLAFTKGKISTFTVNMTGVEADEEETIDNGYELYSGELTEGDYLLVYNGGAMNYTVSSGRLGYYEVEEVAEGVIVPTTEAIIWTLSKSGDYWTICNKATGTYAAGTGVKNKAQMLKNGTDDKSLWTVTVNTTTYDFANKANKAAGVNNTLRRNDTYGFACYSTSTGGALSLYKYCGVGEVAPATLESIAVEKAKTDYIVGEEFVAPTVVATYSDATTANVEATFSGYDMNTAGEQTVTVSYTEDGKTVEASYNITVSEAGATKTYALEFGAEYNSKKISSYTETWSATCGGFTWIIANANNNNNGWSYIKMGRKNNVSVGSITTSTTMPEAIATVTMTVDAVTTSKINSLKLYVATDADFTENLQTIPVKPATGDLEFSVTTPTANCYYKIEVDCASGSGNGLITISKVVYE